MNKKQKALCAAAQYIRNASHQDRSDGYAELADQAAYHADVLEAIADELESTAPSPAPVAVAGQGEAPAGWKLVPIMPTEDMIEEACDVDYRKIAAAEHRAAGYTNDDWCSTGEKFRIQYQAALAAIPASPAPQPVGDGWRQLFARALRKIKYEAATLADAQVIALEALEAADSPIPAPHEGAHTGPLQQAAQAVIDRWNSPKWDWHKQGPTADLMHALAAALAAPHDGAKPVAFMKPGGDVYSMHDCGGVIDPDHTPLYAAPQEHEARDAARWRYLRSQHEVGDETAFAVFAPDSDVKSEATLHEVDSAPGRLDAIIDAARAVKDVK